MFGIKKSFRNFLSKSCICYNLMLAVVFLAMSGLALAQSGSGSSTSTNAVKVEKPSIDWGTTAADMVDALTDIVIVGLGIAISIWVLMLVAKVFKRSAA